MKVCVVAEYYPRRRDPVLGVWAHRQALAARRAGADVRVVALERPVPPVATVRAAVHRSPRPLVRSLRDFAAQPAREERDGLAVEYLRFLSPPRERSYATWGRWARRPLERALERLDAVWPIDLVHAHYALPAGAAAGGFAARRRIPLAVSIHGGDVLGPTLDEPAARRRVAEVLRQSAVTLCNSRSTLQRAAALTGSTRGMRVVHLGAEAPASAGGPRRAEPTVATLGHLVARKRHADVLHAVGLLQARIPDLRLVVIGDGPERPRLERLARSLGLADRVEWAGQLEPKRALEALARCHLMALPSVDEAFGVAYVESLACGVPAIGSEGEGGPEEIAALGGGMLLVPPRDVDALAAEIGAVVASPTRLRELAEAGRATAAEHFSWERCGQATVAAYEDALAGSDR